ncbi:MAG: large conductance mechanosensitive channel protein MscL [Oscillospiraceae bacterium]|nr:large conductance mechanosensitive channel protein MscL [Oscillospiraceae bacterium]
MDKKKKTGWVGEFKAFIMRGNVLDMAVGIVVGSAFTAIITSIVENLLTPIIALIMGKADFSSITVGPFGVGAVINAIITFLITAFVVFWIVRVVNKLSKKKEEAPAEPPAPSAEEVLLTEIRDLLKEKKES